ncbi:MAG TPA: PilZ domain-containing protein [Terriglobia bacterium]|nr:PilZ domain-containing protein [Terriglobia bacterium]
MDQRRYNRVSVEYAALLSGKAYRANGTILSLSILGCRARSTSPLQKGERVGLLITVPGYDHPLYVSRADVQWSHGNEFGMEFIHMEWEGRQRLAEIIRGIEGAADDAPAERGDGAPS